MTQNVLVVRDLAKRFPSAEVNAVDHISFEMKRGEVLGFLGPNGAGKTTTIRMLITTLSPTTGSIEYFGQSLFRHRSEILTKVAFASTYTNLPLFLTVEENLEVHGRLYGLKRAERQGRMKKFLSFFGVDNLRSRRISQLSAGQRTRVMLAKAFLPYPEVALLDEPTASLDPDIALEVRAFVSEQRKQHGVSILFTSHNMDEVAALCDRVIFLSAGRIVATDRPESLAASVANSRVDLEIEDGLAILGTILDSQKLQLEIEGQHARILVPESNIAQLIREIVMAGVKFNRITIDKPSLEDYFLKLAGK